MADEIRKVVTAIEQAGGKLRATDLVNGKSPRERRLLQIGLQSALDRGIVKLDADMKLVVAAGKVAYAA